MTAGPGRRIANASLKTIRPPGSPALAKRDKLNEPERQNILAQLARFTGIDPSLIDAKSLSLARQQFAEQL